MITRKWFAAPVLFSLVFAVTILHAQITTATLVGTVTDSTGAVVPGAQVTVTNVDTNASHTATSNAEGGYRIEFLPVGNYRLEVGAKGFKTYRRSGITLEVAQIAQADISLQIGQTSESVEVNDALPLINVTNPEIGRTVQPQEISSLPLVNRNVYNLLDLTPGVQRNDTAGITLGYPEQRTLINGGVDGGTGSVNYYLDGGNNLTSLRNTGNILPSPDAIQEFRVQTNSYSAEYGRFANGIINVITKSGTNRWHGSLFEFVRNTMFNANPWGSTGLPSPPLHRNQFGGTVGGPIVHDKTFFFLSYSGLRQITNPFLTGATVPSDLERVGDFSQSAIKPIDPLSSPKAFFPNNVIPIGRRDQVAMNIINNFIPRANGPNNTWQGFISNFDDRDEGLLKIDHALTHNQQLTASFFETYGKATVRAGNGNLPWSLQRFDWRQYNANVSDTWTINDHMINQAWLSYTRNFGGRLNLPILSSTSLGSSAIIQGTPSLPQITVSGFFTLAQAIAGPTAGTNFYSVRDVFSYNRGRHSFKFGAELSLNKDIQQTLLNNYGVFSFNNTVTSLTTGPINNRSAGNALASFELGIPNSLTQDAPVTGYTNSWYTAFFAQDDWKVSNRLTLNLGMRYDVQTPPVDTGGLSRASTFVPGPQVLLPGPVVQSTVNPAAPAGMLFAGDPGVPRGIAQTRLDHFSPRIGFAWDLMGDGKTSIRGGAGVFFGSLSGNQWNTTTNFEPFAIRLTIPNAGNAAMGPTLANPYRNFVGGAPFPYNGSFVNGGSIFGVDRNYEWPYTYQLNFSVQRQIGKDFSLMAAYVGSLSHNLPFAIDLNYPLNTATAMTSNVQARRPDQSFGQIFLMASNQTASYHSFQLSATKRMGHHFSLNGFYTYSKAFESVQLQNNTTQALVQDFRNMRADRGRTDDDLRHVFVVSGLWDLSYYSGSSGLAKWLINGWTIDPILKVHSGFPFTLSNGVDANFGGNTNNERAQFLGGTPNGGTCPNGAAVHTINCWFNTSVFAQNVPVNGMPVDGNTPRNFLTGPGFVDVDLAIARHFKIGERFDLEFRAEGTNIFNHANLNPPGSTSSTPGTNGFANQVNTTVNAPPFTNPSNFGRIISANDPRLLQFGVRLNF